MNINNLLKGKENYINHEVSIEGRVVCTTKELFLVDATTLESDVLNIEEKVHFSDYEFSHAIRPYTVQCGGSNLLFLGKARVYGVVEIEESKFVINPNEILIELESAELKKSFITDALINDGLKSLFASINIEKDYINRLGKEAKESIKYCKDVFDYE